MCKALGFAKKDNLGGALVVNTRKELCGAFINKMKIEYVNYTVTEDKKEAVKKDEKETKLFQFAKLDPEKLEKKKSKSVFRWIFSAKCSFVCNFVSGRSASRRTTRLSMSSAATASSADRDTELQKIPVYFLRF